MRYMIPPGTRYDFIGKAPFFAKVSLGLFIVSLLLILLPIPGVGLKFGLDFSGGHEILVSFADQNVKSADVRKSISALNLGDTAVQTFEIPESPRQHFLVKVQRTATFGEKELAELNDAFRSAYGDAFKGPISYNPEAGDVIEVEFTGTATGTETATSAVGAAMAAGQKVATSTPAIAAVVEKTEHKVRLVRKIGRPDQNRYSVVLMGIDVSVIEALQRDVHASAVAERVEFVGPTVGKQLRNDGVLACLYALLCILIYVSLRFDFFFAPGAVACLFHDAIITTGILALLGHEFSLATIAGLLTLIGYSINDTIVIYDRIRERVGKMTGSAGLPDVLNRAMNETLGRTLMTSMTTLFACLCLMWFGRRTVLFDFGLIMGVGVVIGSYSSIYIAAPTFLWLRKRFGTQVVGAGAGAREPSPKKGGEGARAATR